MRLGKAAELVETAVPETLAYYAFPEEHWRRIRTNNPLERIMREIRRRTRVVGAFPDGNSAINLAAARLRHIAGTRWSTKRYLNMELLRQRNAMIAYSSVRRPGGDCVAVFRPRLLSNCRQGQHLCYVWDGRQIATVYEKRSLPGDM
jgi:hypothetical protein